MPGLCGFIFLEEMSVVSLCTPASSSSGIAIPPTDLALPLQQKMLFVGAANLFPCWRKASVITGPRLTNSQHSLSAEAEKKSSFLWSAVGDDTCIGYPKAAASLEEEGMTSPHPQKSHTWNNTRSSPRLCAECLDVSTWPTGLPKALKKL